MAVFSPIGYMIKGGSSKPATLTDMDESDFEESSDGRVSASVSSIKLNLKTLAVNFSGLSISSASLAEFMKDAERTKVKVYFKVELRGKYSKYYNANRTVDFSRASGGFSFKARDFSSEVLQSVTDRSYNLYLAFRTSSNVFFNGSEVDFRVVKT